jgi:hypothetical protein
MEIQKPGTLYEYIIKCQKQIKDFENKDVTKKAMPVVLYQ